MSYLLTFQASRSLRGAGAAAREQWPRKRTLECPYRLLKPRVWYLFKCVSLKKLSANNGLLNCRKMRKQSLNI